MLRSGSFSLAPHTPQYAKSRYASKIVPTFPEECLDQKTLNIRKIGLMSVTFCN